MSVTPKPVPTEVISNETCTRQSDRISDREVELEAFMTTIAIIVDYEVSPDRSVSEHTQEIVKRIHDGYIPHGKDPGMTTMLGLYKDCFKILETKGRDYSVGSNDRVANFRTASSFAGITSLQVWLVFFWKHMSAVFNYIKSGGQSESEPIRGRFLDCITYLLLGYLLVEEKEVSPARSTVTTPGDGKEDRI